MADDDHDHDEEGGGAAERASWRRMIDGLRSGDERAAGEFCARYGAMMHRLAEKHLARGLRRRVGPEDVAQSACRTFLRRARGGQFALGDSDELWRLLCAITLAKVREQARFHGRQRRGLDREVPLGGPVPAADTSSAGDSFFAPADRGPAPDEEVAFDEQFRSLIDSLDEEERRLVQLKLDEHTNEEAAAAMGCSERTVRRVLKKVQARMAQAFETELRPTDPLPDGEP